jgi:hypothetical protein
MSVEVGPGTAIAFNTRQQHGTPTEHSWWYILYRQDPIRDRRTRVHRQAAGACVVATSRWQLATAPLPIKNQPQRGCSLIEPARAFLHANITTAIGRFGQIDFITAVEYPNTRTAGTATAC